jgi:hypothetical protein
VKLSFDAWKPGRVAGVTVRVPVVRAAAGKE